MSGSRRKNTRLQPGKMSPYTILGIIVICIVFSGTLAIKTLSVRSRVQTNAVSIENLKSQKKALEEEKEDIEKYRKYVGTDEYTEKVARDKLGLINKGEIVFKPEGKQ